jgi:hypothetical protein
MVAITAQSVEAAASVSASAGTALALCVVYCSRRQRLECFCDADPEPLTEYEAQKLERIASNRAELARLGLASGSASFLSLPAPRQARPREHRQLEPTRRSTRHRETGLTCVCCIGLQP